MNNNKTNFDELMESFSKVSLSDSQKKSILENIYKTNEPKATKNISSPWNVSSIWTRQSISAFCVCLIILGAGTTYAAANSLPGDILYKAKVRVIEPAILSLQFNEDERNNYKVTLLQKRIIEIETLKQQNKLTTWASLDSYQATDSNVTAIEKKSADVSVYVETYNDLVKPDFHIKSNINDSTASTSIEIESSVNLPITSTLTEVTDVTESLADAKSKIKDDVVKTIAEPLTPVVEKTTEPIKNVTTPVTNALGL